MIRVHGADGKGCGKKAKQQEVSDYEYKEKQEYEGTKKQTRRDRNPSGSEYKHGSALPKKARCDATS